MLTFADARQVVEADLDGEKTAPYGSESERYWFPIPLPERVEGRVPAVSKDKGALTWMDSISEEYTDSHPYGPPRPQPDSTPGDAA